MIEIITLGTACMQPTKDRNHVGTLLRYKNENILFDCGENIQRQLRHLNIKLTKITRIFISHWHGDHTLGLAGLMYSMASDQFAKKLFIYGPKGTKKNLAYLFKAFTNDTPIEHEVMEIDPKTKTVLDFAEFTIEVRPLDHRTPTLGYSFMEKDRLRIKPQYIKKIPGILLGKLQKNKTVTYKNKKITPQEAAYSIKGKKITILMDTRPCNNYLKLSQNADLLISEATFLHEHQEKAEKYYHMTAKEAGLLANQAEVKKLVLLHFSPRYKDISKFREEVKTVFQNVVCAEDFMKFKV
ncbi:ribonuclease Z [Candidatus Woesearchaeota archaeon]|nr:ribonuclease Z [Candidatus Woesearchaeota archaeon]